MDLGDGGEGQGAGDIVLSCATHVVGFDDFCFLYLVIFSLVTFKSFFPH